MSRIHDALKRGSGPASNAAIKRTAQADAVLAALGYQSDQTRSPRAILLITAGVLAVGLLTAWLLMPQSGPLALFRPEPRPVAPPRTQAPTAPALPAAPPKIEATQAPTARVLPAASQKVEVRDRPSHLDIRPQAPTAPALLAIKTPSRTPPLSAPARKPESSPPPVSVMAPAAPKAVPAAPDEFQRALYYQRSGEFEQALMHYRAALQRDEMNIEAHNNLGSLYLGKGLFEEAAREFQRVIAIDPKYLNAHVNLSAAYTRLGRPDAAAAEARAALQIDGRNPDAMVNLSLAQHDAGLTGDAQRTLRRALEIEPRNAAAHYNIARQFEAAGELTSAIAHYNQFIQYASPEQTAFVANVRVRVTALAARLK